MNAVLVPVSNENDLVIARLHGREAAKEVGFGEFDQTLISTAISEMARNIVSYAGTGTIVIEPVESRDRRGIRVRATDEGPGIQDVEAAQREGYSTGAGLGMGLSGIQRLMDEYSIESAPGEGTKVEAVKWL